MAVLDQAKFSMLNEMQAEQSKIDLAIFFWAWFHEHMEDKIVSINLLFIHKTVRVKNIKGIFEMLFGPELTVS